MAIATRVTLKPDTAKKFFDKLDELHRGGKFYGFSIWPTNDGYQVNLATSAPNNWRVRRGETPEEGIALVLGMDFMDDDGLLPRMTAPPAVDEPEFNFEGEKDEAGIFD